MDNNEQKKILVVEDDPTLLQAIKLSLEEHTKSVVETAVDGQEAYDKSLSLHPDLILLDLQLPIKNGLDVIKELRQDEWGKTAKIIVLTNNGKHESIAQALSLNVLDYLVKVDWSLDNLVKKVQDNL